MRKAVAKGVPAFITANCPEGSDGQVERVAGRFGLIAAAGEFAATLGIVPWGQGEVHAAAETCFAAWLTNRGCIGPADVRDGIRALRSFVSAHSTSRFLAAWENEKSDKIVNLAGFRRKTQDGSSWDYFVAAEAWAEATAGFDAKQLAAVLVEGGLLSPQDHRHRAKLVRIPGHGPRRVYHLLSRFLEGDDV